MEDRVFIIDQAPVKGLIPQIIRDKKFTDFRDFYSIRVDWWAYPLIHDRCVTYGLFDDLIYSLPRDQKLLSTLLDHAIKIIQTEVHQRFICALYLILDIFRISHKLSIPSLEQTKLILELKPLVQKFSFVANMSSFWEQIINFLHKKNRLEKPSNYLINDHDYELFFDLNFPSAYFPCPIKTNRIKKEIEGAVGEYEPLTLLTSAKIENINYWVWLYKNISGNVWSWYITVREDEDSNIQIRRHSIHGKITRSPEKLILEYHYNT